MAFTKVELDNFHIKYAPEFNYFNTQIPLSTTVNYSTIVDYLTGYSNTLNNLQDDFSNYHWGWLVTLLENFHAPGPKDQLILDLLAHPNMFNYTNHHLQNWLVVYTLQQNKKHVVDAVRRYFISNGLSDEEVFIFYIEALENFQLSNEINLEGTALNDFLLDHVKNITNPLNITSNGRAWGRGWNTFFLRLLEEAKPELVRKYLLQTLLYCYEDVLQAIINWREGYYLQDIINEFNLLPVQQVALRKLNLAIHLIHVDEPKYASWAISACEDYLNHFQKITPKQKWESSIHLKEFNSTPLSYLNYSAVAIHYLLKNGHTMVKALVFEWFQNKTIVSFDMLRILFHHLGKNALPYLKAGLKADSSVGGIDYYRKIIDLLTKEFGAEEYKAVLWELTNSKSRPLREHVARILAENDNEAEQNAIALLQHKSAETRQTAAIILSYIATPSAIDAVQKVLNTESNDEARDILLQLVSDAFPQRDDRQLIQEMVQAALQRNKLSKPIEKWLDEALLPPLYYTNGDQLTELEIRFLLYRMSRVKSMQTDIEAKYLIKQIDKEQSTPFAKQIIQLFTDKKGKPEYKYLMALSALLGYDEIVDKIRSLINNWIEGNRLKMAEYGIGALALQGSNMALRWVEWYSRKYRNKKGNVGAAALQALEVVADEMGISLYELGDRIVPDFGFDGLFKHFEINGDAYRAFIDTNFKLAFFNEDDKKLKTLPAAAPTALKESFKAIAKEVKDVVRLQSTRLEHYLMVQRKWTADEWQQFFLNNPVMFIYATKMLWGIYDETGNLLNAFICLEDTSLLDIVDDELDISDTKFIGMVHPLHMSADLLQSWKQKFFDLSIEPIFPQLGRKTVVLSEEDKHKKIYNSFESKETESGAIKGTLEKWGWRKGATGDGGYVECFKMKHYSENIVAVLEVEGVFVGGFGYDYEPKLGRLFFMDPSKDQSKWLITPRNEEDERLIPLQNVPPIFYSEVMSAILNIKLKKDKEVVA